jgi:hypothetical protein
VGIEAWLDQIYTHAWDTGHHKVSASKTIGPDVFSDAFRLRCEQCAKTWTLTQLELFTDSTAQGASVRDALRTSEGIQRLLENMNLCMAGFVKGPRTSWEKIINDELDLV